MDRSVRVALLGATGHIGRSLGAHLASRCQLTLYARRPDVARAFAATLPLPPPVRPISELGRVEHDVLVNCIGEGDPAGVSDQSVFGEVARYADDLTLSYLERHPQAMLVNMSSGAAYCTDFAEPARGAELLDVECASHDPYVRAKRSSEDRHRALDGAAIVDLRLFGFFSRYIDLDTTYLMTQIVRALRDGTTFVTGPVDIRRDYVSPADLASLVAACIAAGGRNTAYDVYSAAPVRKFEILEAFAGRFDLAYDVVESEKRSVAGKPAYYSLDRRAAQIGYEPTATSLEALEEETAALLTTRG